MKKFYLVLLIVLSFFGFSERVDAAKELVKRYPTKLLDEEQRLKLEKLKAEVDNIKTSTEAIKVEIVDDIPCD